MASLLKTKLPSFCFLLKGAIQTKLPCIHVRYAGHAKWQNIKTTKEANDLAKGRRNSRYVMLVKKAIVMNKMQTDPKLNSQLAAVISEALKLNVPKATIERAIDRAKNIKVISVNLEIQGSAGYSMIVRCETDNIPNLRRDIKKSLKKFDAHLMPEDSVINMFKSMGYVRTDTKTIDGREISGDYAEEAAILANATEVYLEEDFPDSDGKPKNVWTFTTDADTLNTCRGSLEKQCLNILSTDLELVAFRPIEFDEKTVASVQALEANLKEMESVLEVYHNVSLK